MHILTASWLLIMVGVTAVHWILPARYRGWFLVLACAGFVGVMSPVSLFILTALTFLYYALAGRKNSIHGNTLILLICITGALLCVFKAAVQIDFGGRLQDLVIPVGLAYYTFRCIHYAIEKYKGTIPAHGFEDFAQYMFFLPTMLAGPIHRYPEFDQYLRRKRWDSVQFISGLERILWGYFKIIFVVNFFLEMQIEVVAMVLEDIAPWLSAYIVMIQLSLTVYLLFSGYSDIAIGFGMLVGFKVMENFNHPYKAVNISDFWRRWHISLTGWCRDYVYMGVMAKYRNVILAALSAMLVMALWHEFSLRYLLWGIYHGIGVAIWQYFQFLKPHLPDVKNENAQKALRIGSRVLTLHFFMFGLILVQHETLDIGLDHIKTLLLLK